METRGGGCTLEKVVVGSIVGMMVCIEAGRNSENGSTATRKREREKEKRPMIGPVRMEPEAIAEPALTSLFLFFIFSRLPLGLLYGEIPFLEMRALEVHLTLGTVLYHFTIQLLFTTTTIIYYLSPTCLLL